MCYVTIQVAVYMANKSTKYIESWFRASGMWKETAPSCTEVTGTESPSKISSLNTKRLIPRGRVLLEKLIVA
jgi:hypothetical protein